MNKTRSTKYLLIGNSAGSINAVEAIREIDECGSITIVSDEPYQAYSRPMISEYLAGKCTEGKILYRSADFYEKKGTQLILGEKVQKLDTSSRIVKLENGEIIGWGKLLLATGGQPIIPNIDGIGNDGVFTFLTLNDAKAIEKYLSSKVKQVVVIGGGLIGVSVTDALVRRGVKVTIIEMKEHLLNTILDDEISLIVESKLTEAGVKIITGQTVTGINNSSGIGIESVSISNGINLDCDMVIIAIGVQPRIGLAIDSGLEVARGILVDRHMATSAPDIYSCGDAAEAYDFIYRKNRPIPIWPNACMGGRIAGLNMAGVFTEYAGNTSMNSLKYFGLSIVSAGIINPDDNSFEVLVNRHNHNYKKVVLKDGLVVGMIFTGDIEKAGIVFDLMKNMVNVSSFKYSLVAEDFGLTSLPDEIWRPRFEIPSSLLSSAVTAVEESDDMAAGD